MSENMRARRIAGAVVTVLAAVLVFVALVLPDQITRLPPGNPWPRALVRVPIEGLVAAAVLLALPAEASASVCPAPAKLSFERKPGAAAGTLTWRAARGAPKRLAYRVFRDRDVIGQTRRLSMRVRVSVGRGYRFAVRPVTRGGGVMG